MGTSGGGGCPGGGGGGVGVTVFTAYSVVPTSVASCIHVKPPCTSTAVPGCIPRDKGAAPWTSPTLTSGAVWINVGAAALKVFVESINVTTSAPARCPKPTSQ